MKRCRFLSVLIIVSLIICLSPVTSCEVHAGVKKIEISKKEISIEVGENYRLAIYNASKVKWTSTNKKVAKVNKYGKVTGISIGCAKIIGNYNGKKYSCNVTVKSSDTVTFKLGIDKYSNMFADWSEHVLDVKSIDKSDSEIEIVVNKDSFDKFIEILKNKIDEGIQKIPNIQISHDESYLRYCIYCDSPEMCNQETAKCILSPISQEVIIYAYMTGNTIDDTSMTFIDLTTNSEAYTTTFKSSMCIINYEY